ncbi:MAG: transketolase [Chthoniobacterales bacterium]|nr:transketolase [Chthoniobacterales bacterium]
MRNAFADEITKIAQKREDIVLLSGDIGNRLFDKFKEVAPTRFYNCGVAEANMIGVAAGMAASGLKPVCYTIASFITYRVIEQIRLDLGYHHQNVVFVGTGAGLSYASLGSTHHSVEDMGMLRLVPGLAVLAPGDEMELRPALRAALDYPGPVYIRIGKKGEPVVHKTELKVEIGKAVKLRDGKDAWILALGNTLPMAIDAAAQLESGGINCGVASMGSLKPLDTDFLAEVFRSAKAVATLEEHSILGGLGTATAEWMAANGESARAKLLTFGTPDEFLHQTTHQPSARAWAGLTVEQVVKRISETI